MPGVALADGAGAQEGAAVGGNAEEDLGGGDAVGEHVGGGGAGGCGCFAAVMVPGSV